jgi:aryl-alcohol dehydrogenase-like predicted oxidoreductase
VRSGSDPFGDSLYRTPSDFDVVERCTEIAAEHGVPSAQVGLAWLLHRPGVTAPIVGATKPGHLEDALAAEERTLTEDEMRSLEEPYVPHPVLGHG